MILLFDIGNTRAKYCTMDEGKISCPEAIINQQLTSHYLSECFAGITSVIIASVSNEDITHVIRAWCKSNNIRYRRVLSEKKKNNVTSGYKEPKQLGIDRWLALIGAAEIYPNKNVLIIDAGTATTIDFITNEGRHQGGWILAGIKTLISSVLAETTKVEANSMEEESVKFGITSSENVHNAAWASTIGAVHIAISQVKILGYELEEIIITGGNGKVLSSLLSQHNRVIEDLVFRGLQAYT
jgi:type III pantothenate kinase